MRKWITLILLTLSLRTFAATDVELNGLKADMQRMKALAASQQFKLDWVTNQLNEKFGGENLRLCNGSTKGKPWSTHDSYPLPPGSSGIWIDVDASKCKFKEIPKYFTNISSDMSHWRLLGSSAIYFPSKNSFRIFLYSADISDLTKRAQEVNLNIEWIALGQ